ncbi:MAG: hypothetical protein NVS2B8_03970 [Vulcanimicrobiaceae bacterium]
MNLAHPAFGMRLRRALLAGHRAGVRGVGSASARRSDGYEFAELRGYVEGDDPRRIDWAATARAGGLQTRVVLEDRALHLAVALDASHSMRVGRRRSARDLACDAARAWYAAATDDDRCARIGERVLALRDVRGRAAALACANVADTLGASYETAVRLALATLPRGTRLLLASDFHDLAALAPLVRACTARFDVVALVARDPWHAGLPLRGFVRLRDAESGRVVSAYLDRGARERYVRAVAQRELRTCAALRRAGAHVATLDESDGAEVAIARALGFAA